MAWERKDNCYTLAISGLTKREIERLERLAKECNRSVSILVRQILDNWFSSSKHADE